MGKRTVLLALLYLTIGLLLSPVQASASSMMVDYLNEFGITFYNMGRYDEATIEFKKVMLIDPDNDTAKKYIQDIFMQQNVPSPYQEEPQIPIEKEVTPKIAEMPAHKQISRDKMIENTFARLDAGAGISKEPLSEKKEKKEELNVAGFSVSGEAQARLGITPHEAIWKRANWDLNEKNFRILSNTAFDRRQNSYDPRIYDRLRLDIDNNKDAGQGLSFHSNITVDPWSFTGKSKKTTIVHDGDPVELELRYWANTGYTLNDTINTLKNGDSIALPEIKVKEGHITMPVTVKSAFGNIYELPELRLKRQFQPVRELWFDYKQEGLKLRVYPIGYENQALSFDDPLKLSNNHTWWEDSPWLHSWKPGLFNSGVTPVPDFTKGYWDNTYSFAIRDSEGRRLTALRGFSFEYSPQEETSFQTSIASPKDLWQDYSQADNFLSATRFKHLLTENLELGVTGTTRLGYNLEDDNDLDARNFVGGLDLGYELSDGIKANVEVAHSQSNYDMTDSQYETAMGGNAYYVSLIRRYPFESIMDTPGGYDGIKLGKGESSFTKFRLFAARMDDSFDDSLSSYIETRDDEYWSRHLHFRKPFKYYYQGEGQTLTWDDVKNFAIGNGISPGRSTLGFRMEASLWDKTVDNLFDVRNVHATEGKFVENVVRDELTWNMTDKLTSKFLAIYQRMPRTTAGVDPFVFNSRNGEFFLNNQIEDGLDPSVGTGSLGMEYKFSDYVALNGIWEYTNDISVGYDNFPRGLLNGGNRALTYWQDGNKYRDVLNWLNDQQLFPKPPYPYYNIFKTGLTLTPIKELELYLDYTRNSYEKAGQVDDNMNHVGLSANYTPSKKWNFFARYTWSRWQDLDKLITGDTKFYSHHNFFFETIYRLSDDEDFTFQYGEASRDPYMGGVLDIGWDPYGGSLRTIDTQHIFRLYYRRKF